MDEDAGVAPDRLNELLARVEARPEAFGFVQLMRAVEHLRPDLPAVGAAPHPRLEAIRLGQAPHHAFKGADVAGLRRPAATEGQGAPAPWLRVWFLGLLGPFGPLPEHLNTLAFQREAIYHDPTLGRFLDLFNHRLLSLYYRAWRQAQPVIGRDRPGEDRFSVYLGALAGLQPEGGPFDAGHDASRGGRAACTDFAGEAVRAHVAAFSRSGRSADALEAMVSGLLGVRVEVHGFIGRWQALADQDATRLGAARGPLPLGRGLPLGAHVLDVQNSAEMRIGPLGFEGHRSCWPDSTSMQLVATAVRAFTHDEWQMRVRLVLSRAEVPRWRLGGGDTDRCTALGWGCWLGVPAGADDPDDMVFELATVHGRAGTERATGIAKPRSASEEQADVGIDQR